MDETLADRMKSYEAVEAQRRALPSLPVVARLDGRGFSGFTRGLRRPYDPRLTALMIDLTAELVRESSARVGYTQSDEITLVLYSPSHASQLYFDGRIQKLCSVLAAHASAWFNRHLAERIPEKASALPVFDCRVWSVPTLDEAANCVLWREQDATKNAITMAARAHFSDRELHGVDGTRKQEMLRTKGIDWNDYPAEFKRGAYVRRVVRRGRLAADAIDALPPRHNARTNPDLEIERSEVARVELPPLATIQNRVAVLFDGAPYVLRAPGTPPVT